MRVALFIACCLVVLVAGCQDASRRQDAARVADYTLPPVSPWLDPAVKLSSAVRLTTRSGIDMRRALFAPVGSANERQAAIQLRDYSERSDTDPDPQYIYLLDLDQEKLTKVQDIPGKVMGLYPAVEGEGWLTGSLAAAEDAAWDSGMFALTSIAPDAAVKPWDTQERLWPLGVLHGQGLAALPLERLTLAGGLATPLLNWSEKIQRLDFDAQTVKPQAGPWMQLGGAGLAAGLALDYDPALPDQALLTYYTAPGADTRRERHCSFGYYAGGGLSTWIPPMAEVDASILAAVIYQPDGTGKGSQGGAGGIFRLLTLNAGSGQVGVIEDHLPADLPVVADYGVVFYTRQAWTGEEMCWEAWASSADGLRKHLLYSTSDALYLAMEDAAAGRRLLLNRQYLEVKGNEPQLHSELIELSLDPLVDPRKQSDTEPLQAPEKEAPAATQDSLFAPPGAGSGNKSSGGGTSPPGSGSDGPPPIAVPK